MSKEETPDCYLDKKDFTGMSQAEIKEQLAHEYTEKWPDHQYMSARQGFEAGFFAGKYLATKRETPEKPDFEALALQAFEEARPGNIAMWTVKPDDEDAIYWREVFKKGAERIWNDYVVKNHKDD